MTMKSLLSKYALLSFSASFSLLALSAQAATPPSERLPSLQKKATIETPAVKKTVTPPTVIPAETPTVKTTETSETSEASSNVPAQAPVVEATAPAAIPTTLPTSLPAEKKTVPPQTPTVAPQAPGAKTTAATTDSKTMATKLVLNLKQRRVYAYNEDKVLMSYPVAIGKKGWETPTGNFKVIQMVKDPVWQNPWNGKIVPASPKGPIGERWIGFWSDGKNTIGFHGTPTVKSLGTAASHGCVRMRNEDVKVLFEVVTPGLPVVVVPQ